MLSYEKLFSSFIIVFIVASIYSMSVLAKQKPFNGFYVDQTIMKTKDKQGEKSTITFHVRNESDRNAHVNVSVKDFDLKDNRLFIKNNVPSTWSASDWTQVEEDSFALVGGETKEVKLNVSVPENAEMGEHSAVVILRFLPDSSSANQKGNVRIATQIIPVLYVTVTDQNGYVNLIKKWKMSKFHYAKATDHSYLFDYAVSNSGNVHLESQGTLEIKNVLNGKTKKVKIPKVNLLPNASKTIAAQWKPTASFGIYQVTSSFSMDGNKFVTNHAKIYDIPWLFVVLSFVVLILIVLAIRFYIKSLKRRMLEEAKRQILSEEKDH